jgi:hypothetical protein
MRPHQLTSLALALALLGPAPVRAGLEIIQTRIGFPAGGEKAHFKSGNWVPVGVKLANNSDAPLPPGCKLVVEAPDSDDLTGQFSQDLPELAPNSQEDIFTYTRLGNPSGDVTLTVLGPGGKPLLSVKARRDYRDVLDAGTPLVLALGSPLPDLGQALAANGDKPGSRGTEVVYLTSVQELPTRWFGYQGLDLVVLATSQKDFVEKLLGDAQGRKQALAEWVRRGGRLIISTGASKHVQLRAELVKQLGLLDCEIVPAEPARWDRLETVEAWAREARKVEQPFVSGVRGNKIEVARLQLVRRPVRRIDVLIRKPDNEGDPDDRPLAVQAPAGLGRVVLTAFDLDEAPFTAWSGREAFWRQLTVLLGVRPEEQAAQGNRTMWNLQSNQLSSQFQDGLETFDEVPVISFGWVALFILLYILVVGPLDYWFLKKVVKRLELTWITFPVVVLTISVAAYFTAYYLKGNDLKMNKVDVVDLVADAEPDGSQTAATQAYGTTWFTLFSPHIKHYTIGIEPAFPGWVPEAGGRGNPYAVLVNPLDRPESAYGGMGRQGSGGLFRRAFAFEPDQAGLVGVPVQVWSTKSFTGSWQKTLPRGTNLFTAQLRHEDAGHVSGWIESGLPVVLQDAVLLHGREVYALGNLAPHERIASIKLGTEQGRFRETWFQEKFFRPNFKTTNSSVGGKLPGSQEAPSQLIKKVLFHDADPNKGTVRNDGLHEFDQSWRLMDPRRSQEEVIVFGRIAPFEAAAEDVTRNDASATRLWLDELPTAGKPRPKVAGTLLQETYVRVFIPILKQ